MFVTMYTSFNRQSSPIIMPLSVFTVTRLAHAYNNNNISLRLISLEGITRNHRQTRSVYTHNIPMIALVAHLVHVSSWGPETFVWRADNRLTSDETFPERKWLISSSFSRKTKRLISKKNEFACIFKLQCIIKIYVFLVEYMAMANLYRNRYNTEMRGAKIKLVALKVEYLIWTVYRFTYR